MWNYNAVLQREVKAGKAGNAKVSLYIYIMDQRKRTESTSKEEEYAIN